VTPFLGTRGRLHTAAASLPVALAAELLKWQEPAARISEILVFLKTGAIKVIASSAPTTSAQ
jgi:hypothetical protein